MGSTGVGVFGGLRRTTVLRQTAAGMVPLIVLAIAAAALPAYALIYAELERQTWDRVERGAAKSEALIEAELDRLADVAVLAAQRPTLLALAADGNPEQLEPYLDTFRRGTDADQVIVQTVDGVTVCSTSPARGTCLRAERRIGPTTFHPSRSP